MTSSSTFNARRLDPPGHRHGQVTLLIAVAMVFILGLAALAVDIGFLFANYGQLQTCADSGSLAGAETLITDGLVKTSPDYTSSQTAARAAAVQYASLNQVSNSFPSVDSNSSNDPNGDVVLGYLADPTNPSSSLDTSNPALFNAVQVRVRKTAQMNGLVTAFFSRVWGSSGDAVVARATGLMSSSVVGFQVTSESGNAGILPFAVKKESWEALLAGTGSDSFRLDDDADGVDDDGDGDAWDDDPDDVVSGSDGILELNMYPLENGASGNFGTVDIGSSNNSTADLERQIRYGVNASDLSYFGGKLMLGADGTLVLNGDTGISAGVKDALEAVKGKPRSICLYSSVTGNGNNAMYTIVGFVGVRIVKVKLTGNPKYVIVQPAAVVDGSALVGSSPNQSKYLYSNVRLVR